MPRPRLDTSALPGLVPDLPRVERPEPTAYLANVDSLWVLCDDRGTPESLHAPIVAEPDSRFVYYGFASKEAAEAHRVRIGAPKTFKPVEFRRTMTF